MALIIGSNDSDFGTSGLGNLLGTDQVDTVFGLDGDDVIASLDGNDTLLAGAGNDSVFGGDGDDLAFLGDGNDLFGWNPGEDNDTIEGGNGLDTMLFNGANIAEQVDMSAVGERLRFFRDIANVVMDTNDLEQVDFNALGGIDTITVNDLTGTDVKQINLNLATAGSTAGDGATDTITLNGSGNGDAIKVSGAAGKTTVKGLAAQVDIVGGDGDRDRLVINPLLGVDEVTIDDLTGAGLQTVEVNLATLGSTVGDGAPDLTTLNASHRNDVLNISGVGNSATVSGLGAEVKILGTDLGQDLLVVNGLGGNDTIDATNLLADSSSSPGAMQLLLDGGKGDDLLLGGAADDLLLGGDGNDFVDGKRGNDTAFLGAGRDAFLWNPGEGNDTIDGGAGHDTMLFNGAGASEVIDMLANGERFTFLRNIGAVVMDTNNLEQVDFRAFGGADTININDLTGTDIKQINLNLGISGTAGGDGEIDTINITGSAGHDAIRIATSGQDVVVSGLTADVSIFRADASDRLLVSGGDGNDQIKADHLDLNRIQLTLDGGAGHDNLVGSVNIDTLLGGQGSDNLLGGKGADILTGNEGNDSFRFDHLDQAGDTITDFVAADDQILIRAAGFGGGLNAGAPISTSQFVLGAAAADGSDRFIYNNTSGELFFDRDGTGHQAQVLLATLSGAPTITNTDIVVV
ncbi:calcium-binding protein [Nodosilinea sp. FACHB-131]|uniref:calcium-binding protein n=1 Tax=Cyanophyceae TaxID=3028117 RepID=UPI00168A08A2|nr:calcium-binding protein [Nodosilinea sp. FACHB-131]MBD1873389.1 calcium-binding protein [Nodosilinea sp. FACHB-131]